MSLLSTTTTRARVLKKIIDQDGYNILWSEARNSTDVSAIKFMFKSTIVFDANDTVYLSGFTDTMMDFITNFEKNGNIRANVSTTALDETPCLIIKSVHRASNQLASTFCYTAYLQDPSKYALIHIDYDPSIIAGVYLTSTFERWDSETMEEEDKAYLVIAKPLYGSTPVPSDIVEPVLIQRLGGGGGGGGTAEEITVVTGVTGTYCTGASVSSDRRTLTLTFDNATTTTVTKNFLVEDE